MILYSYRMSYDEGFAPNPYFGVLTLATCKPAIRRSGPLASELNAGNEVWISGWAAQRLAPPTGGERSLIWLGKVTKCIPLGEYWEQYHDKRPKGGKAELNGCGGTQPQCAKTGCGGINPAAEHDPAYYGDNIYSYNADEELGYKWHPNNFHGIGEKPKDVGGKNALICEEFYYFGHKELMLQVPEEFMPRVSTSRATAIDVNPQDFINYVKAQPCLISHLNPIPKK